VTAFFDTNVLVYRQDTADAARCGVAQALIESAVADGSFTVSTQVLQEFYAAMVRKRLIPPDAAQALCRQWAELTVVNTTVELLLRGFALQQRHRMSVWDALTVQAALDAGCTTLFTEDLQHGMRFGALTVVNPFMPPSLHEPAALYGVAP